MSGDKFEKARHDYEEDQKALNKRYHILFYIEEEKDCIVFAKDEVEAEQLAMMNMDHNHLNKVRTIKWDITKIVELEDKKFNDGGGI